MSDTIESSGFESSISGLKTGGFISAQVTLDYIAAIFITSDLSHFLYDFLWRIGRNMV